MIRTSRHLRMFLPLAIALGISKNANADASMPAKTQAQTQAQTQARARQLIQESGPMGQYQLSRREARAAYADALKACKSLAPGEREPCTGEAQKNFQNDLAYASQLYNRARQMLPIPSPQAQYKNARREAYAAFNEASRGCKSMAVQDRKDCMKNARSRLQADLAYAKNELATMTNGGEGSEGASQHGQSNQSGH